MSGSARSWRELARRWGIMDPQTGAFEIGETVQPVVIIDDATTLQLPPVVPCWGISANISAVAAQWSQFVVQPRVRPIIVLQVNGITSTLSSYWGVNDGDQSTLLAASPPQRIQGPVGATVDAVTRVGNSATNLTIGGVVPDVLAGQGRFEIGVIVLPGQYFFVQSTIQNLAQYGAIMWCEIPIDGDSWYTSLPRT